MAQSITVSLLLSPQQHSAFITVFEEFTAETGILVRTIMSKDNDYKLQLQSWLEDSVGTPDVLHWQASQRLFFYSRQGLLRPITKLWQQLDLAEHMSHVEDSVKDQGEIYGLPFSYYHWGIFYRKSLVARFGGPQHNWEDFIAQLDKMKQAGITPIGIGSKFFWPAAAWFDYINLRINGLQFHQQVLAGKVAFSDQRIQQVLRQWARLIQAGYFNADHQKYAWDEVLPYFYRERTAFLLIGNFASTKWPQRLRDDIGFMPFPTMSDIPSYELAPTDIFMIAQHTSKQQEAELFLKFMARPEIQAKLNKDLGYIPVFQQGQQDIAPSALLGAKMLKQAAGVAQYFDRDTVPAFEKIAVRAFVQFLNDANVEVLTEQLETARKEIFLASP